MSVEAVPEVSEDAPTTRYSRPKEFAWEMAVGCFVILLFMGCLWFLFVTGQEKGL